MTITALFIVILFVALGLGLGYFLAYSAQRFHVAKDPKLEELEAALPGSNCGACGMPGCAGLAEAIFKGEADYRGCLVGGQSTQEKLAAILGVSAEGDYQKQTAVIRCKGFDPVIAKAKFVYIGSPSCVMAEKLSGGWKSCENGCLMKGDCVRVCPFDAMKEGPLGEPIVIEENCTACGLCVKACPRQIISLEPVQAQTVVVTCVSHDKGADTRKNCSVGCIACGLCVKACKYDAIHVTDFLARIDQGKCTSCLECVKVCPTKSIDIHQFSAAQPAITTTEIITDGGCASCGVCDR